MTDLPAVHGHDEFALTGAQLGIWNAQRLDPDTLGYLVGEVLEIAGPEPIELDLLDTAIRRTIAESDTMRLRFSDGVDGARPPEKPTPAPHPPPPGQPGPRGAAPPPPPPGACGASSSSNA
ncbi:hypothetical protein, partial [Nocardia brasiliensis]|uniref:hypothetical protein n=1 Tax=Nocardia brasiliensis TaxID=37326 RepID=UPI002456EDC3